MREPNPRKNVYINDQLTKHRQSLLFAARKLVKSRKLFAAWSQHGNILVRKTEDSNITEVRNHDDLMNIKMDNNFSNDQRSDARTPTELSRQSSDRISIVSHLSNYEYYVDSDFSY